MDFNQLNKMQAEQAAGMKNANALQTPQSMPAESIAHFAQLISQQASELKERSIGLESTLIGVPTISSAPSAVSKDQPSFMTILMNISDTLAMALGSIERIQRSL